MALTTSVIPTRTWCAGASECGNGATSLTLALACPEYAVAHSGSIKIHTTFGGGVVRVKDDEVHSKMAKLLASDPSQPALEWWRKVLKYFVLWVLLNTRLNISMRAVAKWLGVDHQRWFVSQLRGFAGAEQLVRALRRRPCAALEGALRRRRSLGTFCQRQQRRATIRLVDVPGVTVPGLDCSKATYYWLYPVLVDPALRDTVVAGLRQGGIDAACDSTQLSSLGGPDAQATRILKGCIYLPIHRLCDDACIEKIATILETVARAAG